MIGEQRQCQPSWAYHLLDALADDEECRFVQVHGEKRPMSWLERAGEGEVDRGREGEGDRDRDRDSDKGRDSDRDKGRDRDRNRGGR